MTDIGTMREATARVRVREPRKSIRPRAERGFDCFESGRVEEEDDAGVLGCGIRNCVRIRMMVIKRTGIWLRNAVRHPKTSEKKPPKGPPNALPSLHWISKTCDRIHAPERDVRISLRH